MAKTTTDKIGIVLKGSFDYYSFYLNTKKEIKFMNSYNIKIKKMKINIQLYSNG